MNMRPLYAQVFREATELKLKRMEDEVIHYFLGSNENEKPNKVVEWMNEVDNILLVLKDERPDNFWCNKMISRIRKLGAKRGQNFTFRIAQLSLPEELYCGMMLLASVYVVEYFNILYTSEGHQERKHEVFKFLVMIKGKLQEKIPETDSNWYGNKIAEIKMLIDKCEPSLSLQFQDAGSSSKNMHKMALLSLHEELRCEIRLLNSLKSADLIAIHTLLADNLAIARKEFGEWINEVNKLLTEINLNLEGKFLEKDLDWYRNKIAELRTLIAKRYLARPLRPQDVGYKVQYQIFLSFRGEDTRKGFTLNLYNALRQEGFNTFMDDRGLQRGEPIAHVLMRAIESSKLSIIIFSTNFANSTWCLNEVVKILECRKKKNQLVWPIFYKVEPSDVDKAMAEQETRFEKNDEMVNKWRLALKQVYGLDDAFPFREDNGCESDFIQSILEAATKIRYYL